MIRIDECHFRDEHQRTLLLRGVNLGGSSKVPSMPDGATYRSEHFFEHRAVSFVGRPFPLAQADEHFARLRAWGLTFLRLLVTWEAIEHAGPGLYDENYLDYMVALVRKAETYGIQMVIDPHQDVWSRFTGGDGAPGWTLEAVGFQLDRLHDCGAALLHQIAGDPFPRMHWPTNGHKLAAATMFTLFFAGNDFAPQVKIAGEPAQDHLQRHYCDAIARLAERLRDCPNVVGYDTMNEPLHGYIGVQDLRQRWPFNIGLSPTPFQGMALGAGHSLPVDVYELRFLRGMQVKGKVLANPEGQRAWQPDAPDIWRQHGVWDLAPDHTPRLLRPDYFATANGRPVDFSQDYYRPFANRFAQTIRKVHPAAAIFVQTEVSHPPPRWGATDATDIVFAPHWYDALTLMLKRFHPWFILEPERRKLVIGPSAVRSSIRRQLAALQQQARERLGDIPVLLGETGIPFDLEEGKAYRTGNYRAQVAAANRIMTGVEDMLMHCTWWNYTADNDHQHGDQWNGEDLSIFSADSKVPPGDIYAGGRALAAIVRPYPRAIAGELLAVRFDPFSGSFSFTFRHDSRATAPTEVFIPAFHYPRGYRIIVSDGTVEDHKSEQVVIYLHTTDRSEHTLSIRRR